MCFAFLCVWKFYTGIVAGVALNGEIKFLKILLRWYNLSLISFERKMTIS